MNYRNIFLSLTLLLATTASGWSQGQMEAHIRETMAIVSQNAQTTAQLYSMAQMAGDQQGMQLCEYEAKVHQTLYSELKGLLERPQALADPQTQRALDQTLWEYHYRSQSRDWRPYEQVAQRIQQFKQQRLWMATTPEGQRAFQQRMQQNQSNFESNQAAHRQRQKAFDDSVASWRRDSARDDRYHRQTINTIHDQYEYVDPRNGDSYVTPNTFDNPTLVDENGESVELVPYQNWEY